MSMVSKKQIDLCQNCYQINKLLNIHILGGIGGNPQSSSNQTNQSSDPFPDDFFNNLSAFPAFGSQGFQNTPPTQSGGNNNGRGGNGNNNFRPNGPAQQEPKVLLEEFGINVTDIARRGDIDPVIGRDAEIVRVIEILNRRTKTILFLSENLVFKTAVVEGLAQKIVDGNVPQKLQNKQVIRLDVLSLVQGTGIRGQFEERMQKLMEEIRERKDVILFIDEIHEIVGAGNAGDGNMDAGNILKPALARVELQLVGATTLNEYRIIEKDAALEARQSMKS